MNKGKKWSEADDKSLISHHSSGKSLAQIAGLLGRTERAIEARLERAGIFESGVLTDAQRAHIRDTLGQLTIELGCPYRDLLKYLRTLEPDMATKATPPTATLPTLPQTTAPTAIEEIEIADDEPVVAVPAVTPPAPLPPLTGEQQAAFDLFCTGQSMCLTGPAGTGKSHILKHIREYCQREGRKFAITAMTGVAACIVGGGTVHRWTGLGLIDGSVAESVAIINRNSACLERWKNVDVLVIDEISMMCVEIFEKLESIARGVRDNNTFFGGIQVLFCGDFAQLGPIKAKGFVFESNLWRDHLSERTVYLQQVVRQDDPELIQLLSEVRLGVVTPKTKRILNGRTVRTENEATVTVETDDGQITIEPTRLYPHRKTADKVNSDRLTALKSAGNASRIYTATDSKCVHRGGGSNGGAKVPVLPGDTKAIEDRCPKIIELAVGALVMLTVNIDVEAGLVNGSRGTIMEFTANGWPRVQFSNGAYEEVAPFVFESVLENGVVRRNQVPLMLAWAITIHKCQGSTLDGVLADLRMAFCESQVYVTLSRIRALDSLFLLGIDYSKIYCHPKVKEYYQCLDEGRPYENTKVYLIQDAPDVSTCLC